MDRSESALQQEIPGRCFRVHTAHLQLLAGTGTARRDLTHFRAGVLSMARSGNTKSKLPENGKKDEGWLGVIKLLAFIRTGTIEGCDVHASCAGHAMVNNLPSSACNLICYVLSYHKFLCRAAQRQEEHHPASVGGEQ
jgi:hypothetical protein